jgi:hypothetical protein
VNTSKREIKGLELAVAGAVQRIAYDEWEVSGSNGRRWTVVCHRNHDGEELWECDCPDYIHREVTCKHIHAVQALDSAIRQYILSARHYGLEVATLQAGVRVRASIEAKRWGW